MSICTLEHLLKHIIYTRARIMRIHATNNSVESERAHIWQKWIYITTNVCIMWIFSMGFRSLGILWNIMWIREIRFRIQLDASEEPRRKKPSKQTNLLMKSSGILPMRSKASQRARNASIVESIMWHEVRILHLGSITPPSNFINLTN